ncbi:MAG: glycogen synthase GlgA [Candidatus Sumerlaeaceae bacterium]|nr:glycogen synthase GlgA [Candidatus Sumerlaeaceae bacterium]
MRILFVASEVFPFAKTGGLADVAGSLPLALASMGHDVRVAMPKYAAVDETRYNLVPILDEIIVRLGDTSYLTQIKRSFFPGTNVPVYFVQNHSLFGRPGLYQENGTDYADNDIRFGAFCKAVLWLIKALDWQPDIIHCNDWQTALLPIYLRNDPEVASADLAFKKQKVLYTIHNLAYQGLFGWDSLARLGLPPSLFAPDQLEFYGKINLMKGGILYSDAISTVSRRYADEIQTEEFGCGLDGLLRQRRDKLYGIMNGIDYSVWDPRTDPHLPVHYGANSLGGKTRCKKALQEELGLEVDAATPVVGMITRLDPQKGLDLVAEAMDEIMTEKVQFILLGSGHAEFHEFFAQAARKYPRRMSVNLRLDIPLSHRIEAGADLFLMPSRFEPCGLNQLYSMRYGTIPVVRRVGGLADSVIDATEENVAKARATGFVFDEYSAKAMMVALRRALAAYHKKTLWRQLQRTAMAQDFSWDASARKYVELFQNMLTER